MTTTSEWQRQGLPRIGIWSGSYGLGIMPSDRSRQYIGELQERGYEMVWISESFGREVMAHAALLLSRSDGLFLGTGIANVWARDPVAMANGARTITEAFPGRFVLGIGISHQLTVDPRGHRYANPIETMESYIEAMDSAPWRGETAPPIGPRVIGALGPKMLEVSARMTDGAHPYLVTPNHTAQARALLGDSAMLAPEQGVLVTTDADAARSAARHDLSRYLERPNYRRSFQRQGFTEHDMANGGSDRLIDEIFAWGDPESVAARIRQHLDAGADHVAIQPIPLNRGDDGLATMAALAAHVLER